jgi:hypothetical protein
MQNKTLRTIKYFFIFTVVFQLCCLIFLFALPETSHAINFNPQIDIGVSGEVKGSTIGDYIRAIYKFAIGAVGIVAAVVLMYGGVLWIMSAGNPERVGNAKGYITGAISGLVLALASWLILYMVNPELVNLRPISPPKPAKTVACCGKKVGHFGGCKPEGENKYYCDRTNCKEAGIDGGVWPLKSELDQCVWDLKTDSFHLEEYVYCWYKDTTLGEIDYYCKILSREKCKSPDGQICEKGCSSGKGCNDSQR